MTDSNGNGRWRAPDDWPAGDGPAEPSKRAALCSDDDWLAIVRTAVEQAKQGDPLARQWVSDALWGSCVQRVQMQVTTRTIEPTPAERGDAARGDLVRLLETLGATKGDDEDTDDR